MTDTKLDEDVKKIITSILTSSPLQMDVNQLRRDYYDLIGENIPFKRLGFNNLEDYLQSIPDVVKVSGRGPQALLEVVVTNRSAHINKFVSKQKVCVKNKRRLPKQRNFSHYESRHKSNIRRLQNLQLKEEAQLQNLNEPVPSCSYTTQQSNDYCDEIIEISSSSSEDVNMEITNDIFKEISSRKNIRVPLNVQMNLKQLISEYKNGIWCANISSAYKNRFNETLNYSDYGYFSLAQLCSDLGDCFNFIKPGKGDIKIYDKSFKIKDHLTENVLVSQNADGLVEESASSALPAQMNEILDEYYRYKCPKDIVNYGDIMETIKVTDFKKNDYLSVKVAEIYDPSKFWIIINSEECSANLDKMMDDMQKFYGNDPSYYIPDYLIKVGTYCVAIIYNEYHRGVIVSLINNDVENIKVFFVDYGTVAKIPSKGICFMRKDFFEVPQQAIRARLYGVYPVNTDTQWSVTSSNRLLQLVEKKDLYAEIQHIDIKRNAFELILADTTTDDDIFINDTLVNEGHALFTDKEQNMINPKFKPIVKYIHLFPTFDEIENGIVPSLSEMPSLLNSLDLYRMYPHYFEPLYTKPTKYLNESDVDFHVRRPKDCLTKNCNVDVLLDSNNTLNINNDGGTIKIQTNETFMNQTNHLDDSTMLRRPIAKNVDVINSSITHKNHGRPPPGFSHINIPIPRMSPLFVPPNVQFAYPFHQYYQTPCPVYIASPLHYMQLPEIVQNRELNDLNMQLNNCNLTNQTDNLVVNETVNTTASYHYQGDMKFVSIHDFRGIILHIVRYMNEKYLLMGEVIKQFIDEEMSIIRIKRILAKNHSVKLLSLDTNSNKDLRDEIIRLKLLKENDNTIHLVLSIDLPNFIRMLNKEFVDVDEYETFLLNIK